MTSDLLLDRSEIEDAVIRMFVATDERDWSTVKSCFTDPFTLDMTSLVGGNPSPMSPAQVANAWSEGLKAMDFVHHQLGNFQTTISGNQASVRCYGTAFHHRAKVDGVKTRVFVGTYELQLIKLLGKWLISNMKYVSKFVEGNMDLDKLSPILDDMRRGGLSRAAQKVIIESFSRVRATVAYPKS